MANYHETFQKICVGDQILYAGKPGKIVFVAEDNSFLPEFEAGEWRYLKKGIGVQIDGGELYCLDEPDEDLTRRT